MSGREASKIRGSTVLLWVMLAVGGCMLLLTNVMLRFWNEEQFVHLAGSFLRGTISFAQPPGENWADTSPFQGRHYWPLGPFPAVLLLPFVLLFGTTMQQGFLSFFLTTVNAVLLYRIARTITGGHERSLWLMFSYVFATVYLFVATIPWSWYFAHVVATSAILLALHEYFGRTRWALVGLYVGIAFATRISLLLATTFFILGMFKNEKSSWRPLAQLSIPIVLCLALVASYNYARFGDPLETGYRYNILDTEFDGNRARGMWSVSHFPANAYYLFLKGPDAIVAPDSMVLVFPYIKPDKWGMSILFTSPIFLYLAKFRRRPGEEAAWYALVTTGVLLFFTLGNFGIGARQYGYRFALDFSPFLYVMLAYVFRTEPFGWLAKALVIGSFVFNAWLIPRVF